MQVQGLKFPPFDGWSIMRNDYFICHLYYEFTTPFEKTVNGKFNNYTEMADFNALFHL